VHAQVRVFRIPLTGTHGRVPDVLVRVLVVIRSAQFAVSADGVVLAVVADASRHTARCFEHSRVEVAFGCVVVAVAG